MWGDIGNIVLEGTHGEAAWHKSTVDEGGGGGGGGGLVTYMVSFPRAMKTVRCPVPGCPAVSHSAVRMREHFIYRHFFYRIAVVKEGTAPLPQCELCSMHMLEGRLLKYQQTQRCNWNMQMRWRRRDVAVTSRYT